MVLKTGVQADAADVRFGEQVTRTYTYNSDGTVNSVSISGSGTALNLTYAYDTQGRITTVSATGDFTRTQTLTYNLDGTLASIVVT